VVTADNQATVFVNGKRVAASPEWTEPAVAVITGDLRAGSNEVVVVAANAAAGGPAALRAEIRARLPDGSERMVASDGSWQWTAAAADGRGRFPKGKEPTDWKPAVVVENQTIWAGGNAAFAGKLLQGVAPAGLPMVRASLIKGTPLMAALGRPNRDQVVTSRPEDLTTLEAIRLANEQPLADELARGGAAILAAHGSDPDALAGWIFRAALSRPPTAGEQAAARELLGPEPNAATVADCLWAVVMLPEFQLIR